MEWKEVLVTSDRFEAYVVEGLLKDNEIPAVVMDKQDTNFKFGKFKVMVQQENIASAKQILSENDINNNSMQV